MCKVCVVVIIADWRKYKTPKADVSDYYTDSWFSNRQNMNGVRWSDFYSFYFFYKVYFIFCIKQHLDRQKSLKVHP